MLRLAIDVTVADGGQRGDDPVETCDVDEAAVIFLGADGKVWVVEPRAPALRLSDQDPPAGNHMHDREEDDQLAEYALYVALGLLRDVALGHHGIDRLVQDSHSTVEVIRAQKLQVVHPAVLVVEEQRQRR